MRRRAGSHREPLTAVCNHPTRRPAKGFSRIKVIRRFDCRRPAGPWTCRCRLAIVTVRLTLSAFWRPILTPDGHVVAMKDAEFQWRASAIRDWRPTRRAALPAWLWTADGKRILWANPAGARLFGAANAAALAEKIFGPADRHRRQIARLAGRLLANGAIRLERLQGFGAAPGVLATCGCSRFDFPDGSHGVLIAAGNIALIAPRPARTQPDDAMPPAEPHHPSRPRCRAALRRKPVVAAERTRQRRVIEQPAAPQPARRLDEQPAPSGEAPRRDCVCSMRLRESAARRSRAASSAARRRDASMETRPRDSSPAIEALAGQPVPQARRLPLRFTWQMDREGRFTLGTDEFTGLVGPRTTAAFGRPWREIAETFGLDPEGRMMQAFATRRDLERHHAELAGGRRRPLPVELSGLPIFDAARNFIGYRGFGVCRDFDALARLAALRLAELSGEMADAARTVRCAICRAGQRCIAFIDELPEPIAAKTTAAETSAAETSHQNDLETPVEPPKEALRKASRKFQRKRPGNRQGHADGNRDGVAGRRAAERLAVPRPGRSEAAIADAG